MHRLCTGYAQGMHRVCIGYGYKFCSVEQNRTEQNRYRTEQIQNRSEKIFLNFSKTKDKSISMRYLFLTAKAFKTDILARARLKARRVAEIDLNGQKTGAMAF